MDEYRSAIPESATERVVERYPGGEPQKAEYTLADALVGIRFFFQSGEPGLEIPVKDGVKHGIEYGWIAPGHLESTETFVAGLSHGTAKQWSFDGKLIGTYTMDHGTGIDFWYNELEPGSIALTEVRYMQDGLRHGPEWWLNDDQTSVHEEGFYLAGKAHGILRRWNSSNRLRRGFPQYYVYGQRVKKPAYIRASAKDSTLIQFSEKDNQPTRQFPPEVQERLVFPG